MPDRSTSDITLDTRWRSFWRQFLRRGSYVRREARAQTLGMLVFVLVLLTASALCARTAYLLFRSYSQAVQGQLESAVAQGEPRADIEYPAVTAAVLAPVNSHLDQWSWDSIATADACKGRQVLEVTAQLMSAGLALAHDRTLVRGTNGTRTRRMNRVPGQLPSRMPPADLSFALSKIDRALLDRAPKGWLDSVTAHTQLLCDGDTGFVQPLRPDSVHASRRQYAQGWIATQRTNRALSEAALTSLLVPSTYVIPQVPRRSDTTWKELTTAAIASLYMEDAMRLCVSPGTLDGTSCDSTSSIVQIYFISERSVLRIFPKRPLSELPYNRYWAAAHYFQRYYSTRAAKDVNYDSPPYIDIGDQGVVRTLSRLVPSLNRPDSAGVFGVLFIDYKLPGQRFLDTLARHNIIFDLKVLRLTGSAGLRQLHQGGDYSLSQASVSPARRLVQGVPLWTEVEDAELVGSVSTYAAGLEAGAENHTLGHFGGPEHPTFILPLGAKPLRTFLIVSPRTPHVPWDVYIYGFLATALLVAAASTLSNWRGVARLQLERFENQTFRRNLPVGVLRLDHRDVVLDANQVAEWSLGATQQQEGEQGESDSERRTFGSLILKHILVVRSFTSQGWPAQFSKVPYDEHLHTTREWPTGCTYLAVTRPTASLPDGQGEARPAVGAAGPGADEPAGGGVAAPAKGAGRVIQVSEAPIIGEPPARGTRGRPRARWASRAAEDLGESPMVPRTDLIVLSVLDEGLQQWVRARLSDPAGAEDRP